MSTVPYNMTFLSRTELVAALKHRINPVELTKVESAYELAENVHAPLDRKDGSPWFYHITRVCGIVLNELNIYDTDSLCASLLHDVLEDSETVSKNVLEYNFGSYVAYIVETLTKDLSRQRELPDVVDREHVEQLRHASQDCVLIRLAARLDNFRCLEFNLKRNPIKYVNDTIERYTPLARNSNDANLRYLVDQLQKEGSKFFS